MRKTRLNAYNYRKPNGVSYRLSEFVVSGSEWALPFGTAAGVKPAEVSTEGVPVPADAGTGSETGPDPAALRSGKAPKEGRPKVNRMVIRDRRLKWLLSALMYFQKGRWVLTND